jgi:hypothetical protein
LSVAASPDGRKWSSRGVPRRALVALCLMPYALFICRMPCVGLCGPRVVSPGALVVFLFLLATQAKELPVAAHHTSAYVSIRQHTSA